jgi:hypothetical protein
MKHIKIFEDFSGMGMGAGMGSGELHKVEVIGNFEGITDDGEKMGSISFIVPNALVIYHNDPAMDDEIEGAEEIGKNSASRLQEEVWQVDQNGSSLGNATEEDPLEYFTRLSPDEFVELLESVEPSVYDPGVYNDLDMDMLGDGIEGYDPNFVRTTKSGNYYKREVMLDIV